MSETTSRPATVPAVARAALRPAAMYGIGGAGPDGIETAAGAAARIGAGGVDAHWIVKRTGVAQRYGAQPGDGLDELAAEAGRRALEDAGVDAQDLDLVLVATATADEVTPTAAPLVAHKLGAHRAGAFDVAAACAGWLAVMETGAMFVETGRADLVLVIGAELTTPILDPKDQSTSALMGDGAGAAVIGPATGEGAIHEVLLRHNGDWAALAGVPRNGRVFMKGQETFAIVVDELSAICAEIVERAGMTLDDIDLFVFHQANARILRAVAIRLGLDPQDPRIIDYIAQTGN